MKLDPQKAYLLKTTDLGPIAISIIVPRNGTDFHLPQLYEVLECETIEIAHTTEVAHILIIDEEGKIKGKYPNKMATEICANTSDYIAGHAIFCPKDMLR